jgi:RNA polymerase sigma-70 factor (ECF subfamily)
MTAPSSSIGVAVPAPFAGESRQPMSAETLSERLATIPSRGPLRDRREAALVREAQRGSSDALEELFRRHWRRAHRAAYLVVHDAAAAEDIAQESFLAAIRALDRFDRRRPFGPWLHRITVNRAIDHTRARTLRRESALAPTELVEGATAEPDAISDELMRGLAELGPEQRAVVVLRHLLGYTPGEIGRMLDLPRGTVNSRLRRALDRLQPFVDPAEEGER